MTDVKQLTMAELEAGLENTARSPKDEGVGEFFFGPELARQVMERQQVIVPECTGIRRRWGWRQGRMEVGLLIDKGRL